MQYGRRHRGERARVRLSAVTFWIGFGRMLPADITALCRQLVTVDTMVATERQIRITEAPRHLGSPRTDHIYIDNQATVKCTPPSPRTDRCLGVSRQRDLGLESWCH